MTELTKKIRVNGERLWSSLMEMAKLGATPNGGCNRQALTDEDKRGRDLFAGWCRDAGCTISVDGIGNIFAQRPGEQVDGATVMAGSHLDTQPTGGKFDGVYGVLGALEVIRTLNDHNVVTTAPVTAVAWTNEEGARFPSAMLGSAVWTGRTSVAAGLAEADDSGKTIEEELHRIGYAGQLLPQHLSVKAAFELHIEQGPVLEAANKTIGIVTGVQHMGRHEIVIRGQEAHAGTMPMDMRKDPMAAVAQFLPQLYALAARYAPLSRLTFGVVEVRPGSINTVPGYLRLTADIRHPHAETYAAIVAEFNAIVEAECATLDLPVTLNCFWRAEGVDFDPGCIDAVRDAVTVTELSSMEMISGAGHDACNLAAVVPTSMIFIPCKDGLSHNEAEAADPKHIEAGANVLLHAVLKSAK